MPPLSNQFSPRKPKEPPPSTDESSEQPEWYRQALAFIDSLTKIFLILRSKKSLGRPYQHLGKDVDSSKSKCDRALLFLILIILAKDIWLSKFHLF
ncbi:MAG: hypothetical protein K2Y32_06960 [Candidatus Obscuribacterales bacterium]|nr:hypothetical protein [Candidatus Obscuribacterales bacterium]